MNPINFSVRETIVHTQHNKKAYTNTNKALCAIYNL